MDPSLECCTRKSVLQLPAELVRAQLTHPSSAPRTGGTRPAQLAAGSRDSPGRADGTAPPGSQR